MSTPSDDDQREAERRALRKVRLLVEYLENSDEADAHTQRRLLAAIVIGALAVAAAIGTAVFFTRTPQAPVVIDPAKLPPIQPGPGR